MLVASRGMRVGALGAAPEHEGVRVARGIFGARMAVSLVNDGPVTIVLEA